MVSNELTHDWHKPAKRRLRGTLSIRTPKPDEPANDDRDKPETAT